MNDNQNTSTILLDSEEYVAKLIRDQQDWNEKYGIDLQQHLDRINAFLSINSPSSLNELYQYIKADNITQNYKSEPEIAYIIVLSTIYASELSAGETNHIYQGLTSTESAIGRFNELKFSLINIEWDFDRQGSLDFMVNAIHSQQLSLTALTYFIQISNINKGLVCDLFIEEFIRHQMLDKAAQMTVNKKLIDTNK